MQLDNAALTGMSFVVPGLQHAHPAGRGVTGWLAAALRADRPTGSYLGQYQPFCVELHDALLCFGEITGLCLEPHEQAHRLTYISLLSTLILSLLVLCRLYKALRGPITPQMNPADTLRYISLLSTLILSLLIFYRLYKNSRGPVMSQMNPADTLGYIS